MTLRYEDLAKHPHVFERITGLKVAETEKILKSVGPLWAAREAKKKSHGRGRSLPGAENSLLALLIYYRTYTTQLFVGYLLGGSESTICRAIKLMEKMLIGVVAIKKDRTLKQEELTTLLIDVTEQRTERPKRKQRRQYSGKKKMYTKKTEIAVAPSADGRKPPRIMWVNPGHPGRKHDFAMRKESRDRPPRTTQVYADSGYQGLERLHRNTDIPYKKTKKRPLDPEQKIYNRALARLRVPVEHAINRCKRFRIVKDTYRNKQRGYSLKFNIIAGLVNLKAGYA